MPDEEKSNLEKIIMAGVDAITKTAENAGDILNDLVTRGELTVEQGKALNEELKHTVKESVDAAAKSVQSTAISHFINNMDKFSPEELERIRAKIDELEKSESE